MKAVLVVVIFVILCKCSFGGKREKLVSYPDTKWCGPGNTAENYEDLGTAVETDTCCRDHDHCDDTIGFWEHKYNYFNWRLVDIFNCQCDDAFYDCLKAATSEDTSDELGAIYFNELKVPCFTVSVEELSQWVCTDGYWFWCYEWEEVVVTEELAEVRDPQEY